MRLADALPGRIEAVCDVLKGRVQPAAELAGLVARNALPQVTPAAFVLPLGLRGGTPDAATGLFRQAVEEVAAVLLVLRSASDPTGAAAMPTINELEATLIAGICGWSPAGAMGDVRLVRAALVSLSAGHVLYQIDFALTDQLRITVS